MIKSLRWYPLPTAILLAAFAVQIGASSNFLPWVRTPASGVENGHLVRIYSREAADDHGRLLPYSTYLYLRQHTVTLSGLIGFSETTLRLSTLDGMGVGEVSTKIVSGNYFPLLAKQAHLGRTLVDTDEQRQSGLPPVVLSFADWTRQDNV